MLVYYWIYSLGILWISSSTWWSTIDALKQPKAEFEQCSKPFSHSIVLTDLKGFKRRLVTMLTELAGFSHPKKPLHCSFGHLVVDTWHQLRFFPLRLMDEAISQQRHMCSTLRVLWGSCEHWGTMVFSNLLKKNVISWGLFVLGVRISKILLKMSDKTSHHKKLLSMNLSPTFETFSWSSFHSKGTCLSCLKTTTKPSYLKVVMSGPWKFRNKKGQINHQYVFSLIWFSWTNLSSFTHGFQLFFSLALYLIL